MAMIPETVMWRGTGDAGVAPTDRATQASPLRARPAEGVPRGTPPAGGGAEYGGDADRGGRRQSSDERRLDGAAEQQLFARPGQRPRQDDRQHRIFRQ